MFSYKKAAAAGLAALMTLGMTVAPFAGTNYTPVAGDEMHMEKFLIMPNDANVPNAEFSFTVSGNVTAQPATATTMPVIPGSQASGTPVIGTATFTPSDTTYTAAQASTTNLNSDLGGQLTGRHDSDAFTAAGVAPTADEKYAKKTVSVDFSGVTFSEPGVYRWKIDENVPARTDVTRVDTDGKYLDVYVEDDGTGALDVTGYVLHDDNGTVSKDGTHVTSNTKDGGFLNKLETHNLMFGKQVDGNQGSRDKYFAFTVNISGLTAGDKFDVDITDADGSIAVNPNQATTVITSAVSGQGDQLTASAQGTIQKVFYLQHDQSIVIKGIPTGASYTVTENAEDYTSAGSPQYSRGSGASAETITASDAASGSIAHADIKTGFKNTRTGVVPTGVMLYVLPGFAALAGGAAGVAVMLKKKEDEE